VLAQQAVDQLEPAVVVDELFPVGHPFCAMHDHQLVQQRMQARYIRSEMVVLTEQESASHCAVRISNDQV